MVGIVILMVLPVPSVVLDLLLTINISAAVLILLASLNVRRALDLASFPSLLLIATLFRLGLNVSTTRLILGKGEAGEVITAFGNFVIGGNVDDGLVVFMILVVIQFVVITNGATRVAESCGPRIHWLINCAGVLHEGAGIHPEKKIEDVDPERLRAVFEVNAFGPLVVAKHFLGLLRHEERAVLANVSARVGSIGDNGLGGWYAYRASKAAQNMFTRNLAIELGRRAPNVICVALHPGTVDTDLSRPFQRSVAKGGLFSDAQAADQILDVLGRLSGEDSGSFLAWDGSTIPW